ncbi:hypothetical protein P7996_15830, partial [Staphylococcus aureus]|nr:hypothetical protein [Staphylococcus aureus]
IADCKRFLECLNDKNVETIEHSDWVKHCQNNKQKHPFKLGEEKVTQEGQTGEKTTTTPTTINPLTGEKVGEGEPTTEVTKE